MVSFLIFIILAPPECDAGQINCGTYLFNKTYCIAPHWRCDGVMDCSGKLNYILRYNQMDRNGFFFFLRFKVFSCLRTEYRNI